ncbi:tripartite tricarboxylate transporter substrate binding protein [Variovorax sp. NFACC27]|uniref:Bug family tripartite tricarboxylate transporter substrate binding protein n=1 Tax=unclassified Variovorax TaxID=663243 RepID=UPI000896014F|nr:tripartite tricarboxylate transporter substrate binding protein [Variovorax sp. YR750]SEF26801.1 Tripartite-type tricarboxylate transporter, receptor component TctC [Variovorax sp. NFACC28]SEG61245.1 Tripartite-type tricarboxylate transporter, receptor component TctC [Variovorax sp. NFACC29]SFC61253.1 Tripartite-type tricarboxylate transporter, receptor component TctC [Variovorax sp. NFACC26]SFG68086.1 Tripartite-type tricarboxylate transporter, receptor component TctC [Variovorax sp. NFACC2
MKRIARSLLAVLVSASAFAPAWGQGSPWPSRPIKIITPTPVGVGSDIFARAYADRLSRALQTPVVVENRPGALASIGTDAVAKAAPDGYTILFSTSNPFTMTPFLLSKMPYDAKNDLVPVTQALKGGSFILANAAVPVKNIPELVALAKKEPGRISFASYGSGTTSHLGFELFQEAAGIELLHVPYKQSAAPDLMAGQVQLGFEPPVSALPNIKSGRVKALAYTGSKRSAALPNVPTLSESYPGVEVFTWLGFWVPARTPQAIVDRLNKEIVAITHSPEMGRLLSDAGLDPIGSTPAEAAAVIDREAQAMSRLIKAKNIRID